MIKVGLTGGIGSGKTTVCQRFDALGIPVFDSDSNAKSHLNEYKGELVEIFGADVLQNGEIDKSKLSVIFHDKEKKDALTAIIQPLVIRDYELFCEIHKHLPFCILESAVIFEHNLEKLFDKIIVVTADIGLRIYRTMQRENITREQVLERMRNQDVDSYINKGDFIIRNSICHNMDEQVVEIHRALCELNNK